MRHLLDERSDDRKRYMPAIIVIIIHVTTVSVSRFILLPHLFGVLVNLSMDSRLQVVVPKFSKVRLMAPKFVTSRLNILQFYMLQYIFSLNY